MILPYLRFSRDKRGYENTFVIHSERRRGRLRTRVLYWFRTPPGVKVGRTALDDSALRLIERTNPDIEFDWPRILKGQGAPESPAPPPQASSRSGDSEPRPPRPAAEARPGRHPEPVRPSGPRQQSEPRPLPAGRPDSPAARSLPEAEQRPPREEPEPGREPAVPDPDLPVAEDVASAAQLRLGVEAIRRLKARHADILSRIDERAADASHQDQLKEQAERLNPDSWVTDAEVQAGVEGYEAVLESIRAVVVQGRRRRARSEPPEVASTVDGGSKPEALADQDDDSRASSTREDPSQPV